MFNDIGGKLKTVSVVLFWLSCVAYGIVALIWFSDEEVGIGFAFLIGGPLVSWIYASGSYALGQLVENSDIIVKLMKTDIPNVNTTDEELPSLD